MRRKLRRVVDMLAHGGDAKVHASLKDEAEVLRKQCMKWLHGKGVQGIGISRRTTAGEEHPHLVVKVYVKKKISLAKLSEPVPKFVRSKILAMDIEFDVEEVGEFSFHAVNTGRVRPVTPGFSVSPRVGGAGTIGCLVKTADDSESTYLLSAGHALLNGRSGSIGDALFQQGIEDLGEATAAQIATVTNACDISFGGTGFTNLCDVGIAKFDDGIAFDPAIPDIGVPGAVNPSLRTGMTVQKTGRTTGHTTGQITDIDFQLAMNMRTDVDGTTQRAGFRAQVLCTRYADPGDSGSAICSTAGRLLGFHLAGSNTHSVFSRALPAMNSLGLVLAGAS